MAPRWSPESWRSKPIEQVPVYPDPGELEEVETQLATFPPLVFAGEARELTAKLARVNNDAGGFLTFLAEEWTSSFERYDTAHPYGYYGHRNLIFADPYFPRWWNARNGQTSSALALVKASPASSYRSSASRALPLR